MVEAQPLLTACSGSPISSQGTEGRGAKRSLEDGVGTTQGSMANGAEPTRQMSVTVRGRGNDSTGTRLNLMVLPPNPSRRRVQLRPTMLWVHSIRSKVRVAAQLNGTPAPVTEKMDGEGLVSPKLEDDVEEGELEA